MEDRIKFREITSDQEASALLPGPGRRHLVVLFCEADAPAVEKARECAPQVDIPEDWELVWLDTRRANETARWFGLSEPSGMAVVRDGSLLAVEYECSVEAFRRLVDVAQKQSAALAELG